MKKLVYKLKKAAKKNRFILHTYHKLTGYNPKANMWCRIIMDQDTEALIKELPYQKFSVLEVSGDKWANFGFLSYTNVVYPDVDICKDTLHQQYDLIIAEQVFEHLKYPYRAGKNILNHIKPGGYFLITTPFLIKIHPSPDDCTRWSKSGIQHFLEECGFDVVTSFSWGNRDCVKANFEKWVLYNPKKHSLKNEENFPLVVWALAQKKNELS